MSVLVPDTGLLFWMVLSFGIVLAVLGKYGFPTILRGVEARRKHIADSLDAARRAEEKLAALDARGQQIIDEAHKEKGRILKSAQETSSAIVEKANREAEEQSRRRLIAATAEVEEMKRRAMDEVMGQIAAISVKIAEKVVGEELHDAPRQRQLIDRLLGEEMAGRNKETPES